MALVYARLSEGAHLVLLAVVHWQSGMNMVLVTARADSANDSMHVSASPKAVLVPRSKGLTWLGGLDEDVDLRPEALPRLEIQGNHLPSRARRSPSEVEWSPQAGATQAHAPTLSDAQVLGVLRDAAQAVCWPLASARVVAQGAQVCACVRT